MGKLVLIILAIYCLLLFVVSRFVDKLSKGNSTFFTGNRQSPWYLVSIGMIGASISGITFVSVPGMVLKQDMTYMQMVFGFFIGYLVVAYVLLPLYYKLKLISIYEYLNHRFGEITYKTGASFFILSKIIAASARLYLVAFILHSLLLLEFQIPFYSIVIVLVLFIWLYTYQSGIKTIVWTDTLQTLCLLLALILIVWQICNHLNYTLTDIQQAIFESPHSKIFEWNNWSAKSNFFKLFPSGILIVLVMTGLDQDMMQKNLTCKNIKEAQKNMLWYGFTFIPINFLFLCLGILLLSYASVHQITLPTQGDDILPFITINYLGKFTLLFFTIGIVAASFSSIDSAMVSITTSIYVDILALNKKESLKANFNRKGIHIIVSVAFIVTVLLIHQITDESILNTIYRAASLTYGPLLGLFTLGVLTKIKIKDKIVPYVCIASPILCISLEYIIQSRFQYQFGYEILLVNALATILGVTSLSLKN